MSVTKRHHKAARRARWVPALRLRADQRYDRSPDNDLDLYACRHCGHQSGAAGPLATDEDWETEYAWREEIRSHETGQCRPAGIR